MARQRTSDVATEADWAFHEDRRAMHAVENAARRAAREFDAVEREDALQDALLWLAVRPERYELALETDDWAQLQQDIYSALRQPAVAESNKQARMVSKERLEEEQGWEV